MARPAMNGSRNPRMAVENPATRSVPLGSACGPRSSCAASTAERSVTPGSASRRPAGVSRTRRPAGSMSGVRISRLSTAICCDTVEVVVPSASATARIEPSRDSPRSNSSRRVSMLPLFRISRWFINIRHVDVDGYRRFTGAMNAPPPGCRRRAPGLAGAQGGALRVAASMSAVQLGLALSVPLFGQLGPLGVAGLRLAWAELILVVLVRPRLRHFTRRDLLACCVLGAVTAGVTLLFLLAIARIPLGTASALEFLGPLAVSLFGPGGGHRRWAAPAAVGVVLLTHPWNGGTDLAGLVFALAAGVCWAAYILLTQHVGDHVTGLAGLAVSMPVAGAIALLAAGPSLSRVTWPLLAIMLGLAALHPVIPFRLEFLALRRLTAGAFGTLMSLEPAIAIIAGLLVLRQVPGASAAAGIVLVVIAGIAATRSGGREPVSEDHRASDSHLPPRPPGLAAGIDPRLELVQADAGPRPPFAGCPPPDQPS